MKGKNGIQMSLHPKFHKVFKQMKRICENNNEKELSDKRFSLTIARLFEQNIGGCRKTAENAKIANE